MPISLLMFLALLSASPDGSVAPTESAARRDLRCIATASTLQRLNELRGENADRRASLLAFTLYYVGKVKGAEPDIDLAAAIRGLAPMPREPDAMDAIVKSCLEEFRQVGDQLKAAGKNVQNEQEQ